MEPTAAAPANTPFANRLRKNARHLFKWAARQELTAFRLYDRDLPEAPYVVEWYDGRVHLVEYPRRKSLRQGTLEAEREAAIAAVCEVLEIPVECVFTKTHLPHAWGRSQYGLAGPASAPFTVREHGLVLEVELAEHLDTGLYMDHRKTRARVRAEAAGKRLLNLFAYTGSFTVAAAVGGAQGTTTVDLSATYLDWAARNLAHNGFDVGGAHELVRADVVQWLAEEADRGERRWDLIVLDPPPFSTSKKMRGDFNVQRDHADLVINALSVLAPGGVLYFSTNYLGFELEPGRIPGATFEELTPGSLPEDYPRKDSHRLWKITLGAGSAARGSTRGSTARAPGRRR